MIDDPAATVQRLITRYLISVVAFSIMLGHISPYMLFEKIASPTPHRTKYDDLANIINTIKASSVNDPVTLYVYEHKIPGRWRRQLSRMLDSLVLSNFIERQTAWTCDAGDAYLFYSDPAKHKTRRQKLVLKFAVFMFGLIRTAEQKRRSEEVSKKMDAAVREALGDRKKDMFYLDHLGTTPAKQGRGYGTALCKVLADEADARGAASYLGSSNVETNTPFYNSVGFYTVKEFVVGDDPTWKKPPVVIAVMVREVPTTDYKVELV
ncbi:hypothetical protein EUX98_g3295 [Antrodiella citrinella]|uniref:N-acetyltransferase domain-containing protein n=1 Tax=Antrodiella citrinella TaxID=2447956 RepID=A0A4S4MZQ4_9APHY|nr:hypothetical protein EUX98_g3295 [Antrodiella citrinella]